MTRWILAVLFVVTVSGQAQVFVAPNGADASPGTAERPLATVAKAVEQARSRHEHRVIVKEGAYFDQSVVLKPEDSDLTIEGEKGAVLLGGTELSGWERDGDRAWSAPLPSGRQWDVRMLEVNGRFCPRARFPEKGTLTHESVFDVPWMSTTGGGWKRPPTEAELTTLIYKPGDIPSGMDFRNAEVTVFHMWDESVAGVATNDVGAHTLRLSPKLGHPPGAFGVKAYCLWNVREGMTQPGQWYFDRTRGRIVYWPLPGEDMSKAKVLVPSRRVILSINGATNVTVRNLGFGVTTVPLVMGGFAAAEFNGAIELDRGENLHLDGLRVRNVAGHAIKTLGRVKGLEVVNCEIANCGAGGVYLHGVSNAVRNCLIHDIGLMFPSAIGINGGGEKSVLAHNEIYNTSYSAVDFGSKDSVIEYNLIHDCMRVLHDGAAIYVFGAQNTAIRNNFVRDIADTGGFGASSYYLDEQTRNCVVESNVSINVARPSHNHMATNNIIQNNVFIAEGDMKITLPRSTEFTMKGNVLYATGKITIEGVNNVKEWSKNLMYAGAGKIDGQKLKDYLSVEEVSGVQGDTTVGDPLFVDLKKLDLRYRPNSPALKLGLKPLEFFQAGRVSN